MDKKTSDKNIGDLFTELIQMPEYRLFHQLRTLNTPIYIFEQNYIELKAIIQFVTDDPKAELIGIVRNKDKLERIHLDIIRRLHNFVASVLSLIDHTRNLHKELYSGTGMFPEYNQKVKLEFENDPLSQFVIKLRQYCQHYQAPDIGTTFSITRNGNSFDEKRTVVLFTENLKTFDGWNVKAKEYLNSLDKEIDILQLVTAYRDKVIKFYQWFQTHQVEIHKSELDKYYEKQSEFALCHIEQQISSRLKHRDPRMRLEEEIFSGIIPSDDLEKLENAKISNREKAELAIKLLERQYSIPEDLKGNITKLYLQEVINAA